MPRRSYGLLCVCLVLVATVLWHVLAPPPSEALALKPAAAGSVSRPAVGTPPPVAVSHMESVTMPLPAGFLETILSADASTVSIPLPGGGLATGEVAALRRDADGIRSVRGTITAPEAGRFSFQRQTVPGVAGPLVGFILFDQSETAYKIRPDKKDGSPLLVKTIADAVICRSYAAPPNPQHIPPTHPTDYPIPPDENSIIQLQSMPEATAVVYLDFDGETREFDHWGYYEAAPSLVSNSQIFEVWKGVSEDYQPFNINITTSRAVYDAAPEGRRMQVIITPTTDASPGAAGVAFLNSFNWSGGLVCWSFYSVGKDAVEVISHEVGHTLGLLHDGRVPAQAYYSGHSGWAPIMGLSYYETPSQWSKGEYPNANNPQDDLAIIANDNNDVGYVADDHDSTYATATWMEVSAGGVVSNEGVIGSTGDSDAFRFTTTGGAVTLQISGVAFNPNLDLKAEIFDAAGGLVSSRNPPASLNASFAGVLIPAGDYYLKVTGTGTGDLATGYSDYASLGAYTITGTLNGGITPDRFTIAENSAVGAAVGSVAPRVSHGAGLPIYQIASGNTGSTFGIDSNGHLEVVDASLLDFEELSTRWDVPADFELFVTITDSLNVASETIRVVVTVADVNEVPTFTPPSSVTVPEQLGAGTLVTTVSGTDPDRGDHLTYTIESGNSGGVFTMEPVTGAITVSGPLDFETTSSYLLGIRATDHGVPAHHVDATLEVNLLDIADGQVPGTVIRTFYHQIDGSSVASLTGSSRFPSRPHAEETLHAFDSGVAKGNSYGSTIRGYLIAPATGSYTFWISADDAGELRISPDSNPANAVPRASVSIRTDPGEWDTWTSQQSTPVALVAGQMYFIEARHKEGSGGDHLQVAWQGPGVAEREIVPGRWLVPDPQDYAPWAEARTLVVRSLAENGQRVAQINFIEPDAGQVVTGYSISSGNEAGVFAINAFSGDISVANSGALAAGQTYTLTLAAADSGSPPSSGTGNITLQVLGLGEQLHAWWKLDETSGAIALDSSGGGRNAFLSGAATWIPRDQANQALHLGGASGRANYYGGDALAGDTSFTIAAWIKVPTSHSSDGMLIQQNDAGVAGHIGRYLVYVKGNGKINFSVYGESIPGGADAYQFDLTSSNSIKDNQWHHVACVRDGGTGRVFIDGILRASASGAKVLLNPVLSVAIGYDARNSNSFLNATLDDIRIYQDALTAPQILAVAGTPKIAITSPATAAADIPPDTGLILRAEASDPDGAAPVPAWSQVSGPGTVAFEPSSGTESAASFSEPGTYVLRATADDGVNTGTDDITIRAGVTAASAFTGATWGGGSPGSHYAAGPGGRTLIGASAGIDEGSVEDGFYLLGQSFSGDFDVRARVMFVMDVAGTTGERAGLAVRFGTTGAADEAGGFIGFDAGGGGWWLRREAPGAANAGSFYPGFFVPQWCRMIRNGNMIEFLHSTDGEFWISRGVMNFSGVVRAGLCWSSGNAALSGNSFFEGISGFSTENVGARVLAGADASVTAGIPVDLAASVTDDGLPATAGVAWTKRSGPGTVTFGNAAQAATTAQFSAPGEYVLRLTADDGALQTFDDVVLTAEIVNTLSITATDPDAAETGPDNGSITLTRGGSLIGDLTVLASISGSAVEGEDYTGIPVEVVIPEGQTTALLTLEPFADELIEGPENVVITLLPGDYDILTPTAEVVIADTNHPPFWPAASLDADDADENLAYATTPLSAAAVDPDGDALEFTKLDGPAWLDVATNGSLSGTPLAADLGQNVFTIRATDPGGLSADVELRIFVIYQNDPPSFSSDPLSVADAAVLLPYTGVSLAAHAEDPDLTLGDALVFTKLDGPAWLELSADGTLGGTPQAGDVGLNVFTVRATDAAGSVADATLQLTVLPRLLYLDVNDAAPGSAVAGSITWDGSSIWSPDPGGESATQPWAGGAHAVLSAGSDAAASTITVDGAFAISGLTVEEGSPEFVGGSWLVPSPGTPFQIAGSASVSTEINGGGGIHKTGAGNLLLAGSHSFSGGLSVSAGTLRIDGAITGSGVVVAAEGTLTGSGTISNATSIAGTLAPGNGTGTLATGPLSLTSGARIEWQAGDWTGSAGDGYDLITAQSLDLTGATALTLVLDEEALLNFADSSTSFVVVQTVAGVTGFSAENFTIDASAFPTADGHWSLRVDGNNLVLDYTPLTPFEVWQKERFGEEATDPLVAGDAADPDDDSIPNLIEYALLLDPLVPGPATISHDFTNVSGTDYLRLTVLKNPAATDVTFSVQASGDLTDPGSWTDAETLVEEETASILIVRDALSSSPRFMRLKVIR